MDSLMSDKKILNYDNAYKLGSLSYNILLGSVICFEQISHIEKFQEWMQKIYPELREKPVEKIVFGYQLVIESLLGLFSYGLVSDDSLGFTEDRNYADARFHGVDFNQISERVKK